MKIGVFGGTFDPPHLGHLVLAAEASYQLKLERVFWVLTPHPPHKQVQPLASLESRLEMVQAAVRSEAGFDVSRVDIDRPPPHYAADTMRLLRNSLPDGELFYLMGGDSLHDLPSWHSPAEFVAACDGLGVMLRPGSTIDLDGLNRQLPGLADKVNFVTAPLLEIASSDIRRRILHHRPFRYYLPAAVYGLIVERGLYQG